MTVTMRLLGQMGRLGNQLWQIASTVGVATALGEDYLFPRWDYVDWFNAPASIFVADPPGQESYQSHLLDHIAPRHRGYMQDQSLWANVEDEIIHWFQPSDNAWEVLEATNPKFFAVNPEDRIAVHV